VLPKKILFTENPEKLLLAITVRIEQCLFRG
jgi:hypothetical protein